MDVAVSQTSVFMISLVTLTRRHSGQARRYGPGRRRGGCANIPRRQVGDCHGDCDGLRVDTASSKCSINPSSLGGNAKVRGWQSNISLGRGLQTRAVVEELYKIWRGVQ